MSWQRCQKSWKIKKKEEGFPSAALDRASEENDMQPRRIVGQHHTQWKEACDKEVVEGA
jgi:hypothetical protein